MRRDGWGKGFADHGMKNGGSDASVFVLARGRYSDFRNLVTGPTCQNDRHPSKAIYPFSDPFENLLECRLAAIVKSTRFSIGPRVRFPRFGIAQDKGLIVL